MKHKIWGLSAFVTCCWLVFVARHHPPSRRKIKEIWHGRVFWEGESNTTMLRSSSEKSFAAQFSKPSEQQARAKLPAQKAVAKPMIAICAATHSKSNWRSLDDTTLRNLLIPSIQKTISSADRSQYDFRLYLAADHDDQFWLQNQNNIRTPDWLSVYVGFYDVPEQKIPFNPMMRGAYNDGAEYMVRINDDSEFVTSDWVSKAVANLASYDPPNVGMVGPNCREGNTAIMTHDMVHRTHLDIFEHYYPDVFSAWWIDDWISKVYGPRRSTKMMDWTVKHHTHKHGTRYEVQHHEAQLLKGELEKGAVKIATWLKGNTIKQKEPVKTCWQTYQDTIDSIISVAFVPGKSVMMESTSVKLLCDFMSADKDVLEWGSGGSTNFFSQFVKHWDTVEHDAVWASKIKQQALKGVDYHSVPINWKASTRRDGNYDEFKEYVEFPKTLNKQWDVIFIDGRARVACAESVLRNHLLKKDGIVVVHDWERDHTNKDPDSNYKKMLKYYDVVTEDISGPRHLGILKPKKQVPSTVPEPTNQAKSMGTFKIHVLTMNRAKSLQRLLVSLENSEYDDFTVEVYIHIDKSNDNQGCIRVARTFKFSHGAVAIEVAEQNSGLRDSWFNAWYPKEEERAVIFEDDMEVSPLWFKWLSKAWDAYSDRKDLAGISLQIQTLKAKNPHHNNWNPSSKGSFLYRIPGSWGFSPHPLQWKSFLDWIRGQDLNTLDVSTPGLITSDWWQQLDHRGMWTQYYIYFCVQHDLFTLYANLPERKTLTAHWREKGVHTPTSEGPDFPLASTITLEFPSEPNKYDWNGKRIKTNIKTALQLNGLKNIDEFGDESPYIRKTNVDESLNKSIVMLTWSDRLHTFPNTALMNRLYAKRHGYRRVVSHERLQPQIHQAWEKISKLHQMLQEPSISAVLWLDDDAFVRKQSITIEYWLEQYPNADLIIGRCDAAKFLPHAITSGVMIFRNTPWSRHFLNAVMHSKDCDYKSRTCCWEQDCMKKVLNESDFEFRVAEISLGEFNCQTIHPAYKGECNPWVWHAMGQGSKGTLEQIAEEAYKGEYSDKERREARDGAGKRIKTNIKTALQLNGLKNIDEFGIRLGKHDQDGSVIVGIDDMELMRYKKQASSVKTRPKVTFPLKPQKYAWDGEAIKKPEPRTTKPTLVVTGMTRNDYKHQDATIKTIKRQMNNFDVIKVIIYENDSIDNTLNGLNTWSELLNIPVQIITQTNLKGSRTERFATGRNALIKAVEKISPEPDYMLLIDMDGVSDDLEGVETCLDLPEKWGVCCTNQRDVYYDLWVLRTFDNWCDCDVWYDSKCAADRNAKFKYIPPSSPPIRVKSCFGGAALYNYKRKVKELIHRGAHYEADPVGHVFFHKSLRELDNDLELYIQPKMLNTAPGEHIPAPVKKREMKKKENFNTVPQTSSECPNGFQYHKSPQNLTYKASLRALPPWNWDMLQKKYDKKCETQTSVKSQSDSIHLLSPLTDVVEKIKAASPTCKGGNCNNFLAIEVGTMFGTGTTKHLYQAISKTYNEFQLWTYEGMTERFCIAQNNLKELKHIYIVNELVMRNNILTCMVMPETGTVLSKPGGPSYSELFKKTEHEIQKGVIGGWFETYPVGRTADLVVIDSVRFTHVGIIEALNSANGLISSDTVFVMENDYWENTDELAILRKYFDLENVETLNTPGERWSWVTFKLK